MNSVQIRGAMLMQYNKYNINIKRSIVYHNPISIWTQESTVQMSVLTDQMNEDDTGFHYFIMCRESVVIHTKKYTTQDNVECWLYAKQWPVHNNRHSTTFSNATNDMFNME